MRTRSPRWRHYLGSVIVLFVGACVAVALVVASSATYNNNEKQLLVEDARITAAILGSAPLYTKADLQAAANLAEGSPRPDAVREFRESMGSSVGPGKPFVTAALWSVRGGAVQFLVHVGSAPLVSYSSPGTRQFVAAATSGSLHVRLLAVAGKMRLAYAIASGGDHRNVAYAEEPLPITRRPVARALASFKQLKLAVYLGPPPRHGVLLETNVAGELPLHGPTVTEKVTFGNTALTLVVSPKGPLRGTFAPYTRWFIGGGIVLLTVAAAGVVERLVRRREGAERAAEESERLLEVQREIAQTLQNSLLPQQLPTAQDYEFAVRYLPGAEGVEVGGDWYDVVQLDGGRLFFTVGDVSGRGVRAAALMGTLRNAIDAYAHEGHPPNVVASRLEPFVDVREGHYATLVCGVLDTATGEISMTNAGHLSPLHLRPAGAEFVATAPGPPVGVHHRAYSLTKLGLGVGETLLVFTDGLVERRDEALDESLERLRRSVVLGLPTESLLDHLVETFGSDGAPDDVAILAIHRRVDDRTSVPAANRSELRGGAGGRPGVVGDSLP